MLAGRIVFLSGGGDTYIGLNEDVTSAVHGVVSKPWSIREGTVVPETENVSLTDGAVLLDAVYLYADMADSTGLSRDFQRETAAKVIRAYLDATCRVLRNEGGEIRSFDGDRVMAIFLSGSKNTNAARAGLKIFWAVQNVVRPEVEAWFPSIRSKGFEVKHCVGIASGPALVVRGGVRGNNDLVSIGRPPNVAAKLSEVRNFPYCTYITEPVYKTLLDESKFSNGTDMWEAREREVGGVKTTVYRSSYSWKL